MFHELPSKGKRPSIRKQVALSLSSKLIVLVFTKQPSAERYLARFFCQYFCELLENSSSALKYVPKSFRTFTKKPPVPKSYVSKVAQEQRPDAFCKKVFLEKVFAKFTGKGLFQRLYFNKVAFLGL